MSASLLDPAATLPPRPGHTPPATEVVAGLRRLVQHNRRRWRLLVAVEALSLAVSAPLAYLLLVFVLDNVFHLPVAGRLLASLGFLAGVVGAGWLLVRRRRGLHLSEDQVALSIERHTPGRLQNRLINAVQLAREAPADRRELSEAVVQENCEYLRQVHLQQAARLGPALVGLALAAGLAGVGVGYWLLEPDLLRNAAARIFLPLAPIDPLYRTRFDVEPGDVEAAGDVTVRVTFHKDKERPESLTFLKRQQGKLAAEVVPVPPGDGPVAYTFRDVTGGFEYAVRGGDFTSPYYQVTVPRRVTLLRVRATFHYPEYTGLGAKTVDSTGGDLEALQGTRADVTFVFDRPLERAGLLLDRPAGKGKGQVRPLAREGDGREFRGEVAFADVLGYRLETAQPDRPARRSRPFTVRVLRDQAPKLELTGLDPRTEVQPDSVLALRVVASDDFGLEKVGLFYRKAAAGEEGPAEAAWKPVAVWPGHRKTALRRKHDLSVAGLGLAEGEKIELALRAVDTDPLRKGVWTAGAIYQLSVGGEGVGLQLRYEQILRSEADLKALTRSEEALAGKVVAWLRKLDGGDLRWDDAKNIDALHAAVKDLRGEQEKVKQAAGRAARAMPAETGNLRIAVGMLADTEMVRALRILDSVPGRDGPQAKRAALADGRLTQERIVRSFQELGEQYAGFRSDWELNHMIPFTKMLAERQAKMRDQSRGYAGRGTGSAEEFQRRSMSRRQQKVSDLCLLIRPAFLGLADRLQDQEGALAKAFREGAGSLTSEKLQGPMRQAAADAGAGRWAEAARQQVLAADGLAALHARLRQAQAEAAKKALAALKDRAKSDVQAQKELEQLVPGSADNYVKDFEEIKLEDLMRIREVVGAKKGQGNKDELDFSKVNYDEVDRKIIELEKDSGVRQDPYALTLGKQAEKESVMDLYKGKDRNKVKPFLQEKFDDLVGKLLEETEEVYKNYQTLNLSTNRNNNDPGDVGKIGGKLNSTGAVTATGNKRPPNLQSGGVARTGRQGARAYGLVADQDTYNRKGRDQALEGEQQVADQAGRNKMHDTEENQKDLSTGVGGKAIESKDNHFSLHDAGKWKDEYAKRLEKPQQKRYIVERQDGKFDAKSAAMLRDLTSKQEQVIERLKAIKKELRNLYLPTEHLDDLAADLKAGLASLKERPDGDLFRVQMQSLERLRGALRVFQGAGTSFQPSLPRERALKGRVLDEPARQVIPGYEDAVREYYLRLATQ
jgi:hypothetical protein